jgi:hypothetical protein
MIGSQERLINVINPAIKAIAIILLFVKAYVFLKRVLAVSHFFGFGICFFFLLFKGVRSCHTEATFDKINKEVCFYCDKNIA